MWAERDATPEDARTAATAGVRAALAPLIDDPDGPYVAACRRAEAFLGSWHGEVPAGRPAAADG
jgi:hypothetical protein